SRSASNCIVHRFRPSGGDEQARATSRASARPSSVRSRLGLAGFLRDRAASTPCSTNRWRTRATVSGLTSTASAIFSPVHSGPPGAAGGGVDLGRDGGVGRFLGGRLAGGDRVRELLPLVGGEVPLVLLQGLLPMGCAHQKYGAGPSPQVDGGGLLDRMNRSSR